MYAGIIGNAHPCGDNEQHAEVFSGFMKGETTCYHRISFKKLFLQCLWLQTTAMNFLVALCWQIFFAGPFVRNVFGFFVKKKNKHI